MIQPPIGSSSPNNAAKIASLKVELGQMGLKEEQIKEAFERSNQMHLKLRVIRNQLGLNRKIQTKLEEKSQEKSQGKSIEKRVSIQKLINAIRAYNKDAPKRTKKFNLLDESVQRGQLGLISQLQVGTGFSRSFVPHKIDQGVSAFISEESPESALQNYVNGQIHLDRSKNRLKDSPSSKVNGIRLQENGSAGRTSKQITQMADRLPRLTREDSKNTKMSYKRHNLLIESINKNYATIPRQTEEESSENRYIAQQRSKLMLKPIVSRYRHVV